MTRLPVIATVVVALAVTAMIALGVWQLHRVGEKEALIATYRANIGRPPITFPPMAPVATDAMFRKSQATCLEITGWRAEGGRSADGESGYRLIAECRTGAEGPGLLADMGIASDPKFRPTWRGGQVAGVIVTEPDHRSVLIRAIGTSAPLRPMLIADTPAPGLKSSARPDPADIPNNHRAYAIQWFVFAGVALVIYVLALRRRGWA